MKRAINGLIPHDTYYVYDSYGNLSYVIPPKAADLGTIDTIALNNLCYQYLYDSRNRLIEKKIPGKTWEYIVYDKLDRVVAIGPALSPFNDSSATGWLVTKYDVLSRVVYTSWIEGVGRFLVNSLGRDVLQKTTITNNEQRGNTTLNGVTFGYTNTSQITEQHILTVNYYDDYSYPNPPALIPTVVEGEAVTSNLKGLPTGNWVRVLTTPSETLHEMTYSFYDKKARPLRTYQSNHLGGYTQTDVKLDFIGTTLYTLTKHKKTNTDTEITVLEGFDYTPEGRLLEHTHKINNLAIETLSHNEYDELGQLIIKRVGKIPSTPLQTVDYKYNIRGWLTDINNVDSLGDDLFAFKINYQNPAEIAPNNPALYNGNITETFWRTSNDNTLRKYRYKYDGLNRLTSASYKKPLSSGAGLVFSSGNYDEFVSYDKNGNIKTLERYGDLDDAVDNIIIDNLNYTYDAGNKLVKVKDTSNHPEGFKDGADNNNEYGYDNYGNMIRDDNKGIESITYNHLNLPKKITFISSQNINYLYNALGEKVKKEVVYGAEKTSTDYLDGFQYEKNNLVFLFTSEGYVNFGARAQRGASNYVYNYKDHLGNIRLSYSKATIGDFPVILEENHYYPFGLKHKKYGSVDKDFIEIEGEGGYYVGIDIVPPQTRKPYQYKLNGKEWQDELDLNFHDYGARNYDPALGRWMNVDPLAEKFFDRSPYEYAFSNPLRYIDPTGMSGEDIIFRGTDNKEIRIIAPGDDVEINLPIPLVVSGVINPNFGNTNDIVDTNRFVWGYTIDADVNLGVGLGAQWGGEVSVANFSDDTYGGYNYVYPGGHVNKTIGAKLDVSASVGVNLFVGYNDSKEPINPQGFAGTTYSYNFSADVKDVAGGGFTIAGFSSVENPFSGKGWKGISVGVSAGVGFTANAGSIGQQISKTTLLNNIVPTSQRSYSDKISNTLFPVTSSIIQAIRK